METKVTLLEKKLERDIESAGRNVDSIVEDADTAIDLLVEELDYELNVSDYPTEYLLFKSENRLNAIILHAEYEIQVVNNNLIKDLENDFEKLYGLTGSKSNEFIEKIRNSTEDISEKFETRKEELHSKFKDEQN